jgi:chromosome segregation ATPase
MADPQIANDLVTWAVGIPSVGVVIAYGVSIIRRRVSADAKSLHEDKSYQSMIEAYKKERDETKEERDRMVVRMNTIEAERNEAVGKVGKLTAEVEFLTTQVLELKRLVERLGGSLDLARSEMHRYAIENARLAAHVGYLEDMIENSKSGLKIERYADISAKKLEIPEMPNPNVSNEINTTLPDSRQKS